MVYDIIPQVSGATGSAPVNASVYEVQCMAIPDVLPLGNFDSFNTGVAVAFFESASVNLQAELLMPCKAV